MLMFIAAASLATAVDAERAFAADAQRIGQVTAFRKWSDEAAVMFTPQVVWAHEYLAGKKDPPKSLTWAPAESFVSCDGRTAVNRGPWSSASGKSNGYFTTVWTREKGEWRWVYDGGDKLDEPMPLPPSPIIAKASCSGKARIPAAYRHATKATERLAGQPPADAGQGRSADGTLIYEWKVAANGARNFRAKLWTGRGYRTVLDLDVAPPKE